MSFNDVYKMMQGFVISYKVNCEPLAFNELHTLSNKVQLNNRGQNCAVFQCDNMASFLQEIREEKLIFAQHIHPYGFVCDITGAEDDFDVILEQCKSMQELLNKDIVYTCQGRISSETMLSYGNGELVNLLSEHFKAEGYQIDPQTATAAVSLTVVNSKAYIGVSDLNDNISKWTGGILFYSKAGEFISRAEFKLEEAVEVFDINLSKVNGAIDLGAAPGGWTYYLCKNGIAVDAVDPASLSEVVTNEKNATHYKMTAQEFLRKNPDKRYDLIVNDMKMDSRDSVDIVCMMNEHLNPGGMCIVTLKLPEKEVTKRIKSAKVVLGKYFTDIKVRQLYYNRSEVTVFARK